MHSLTVQRRQNEFLCQSVKGIIQVDMHYTYSQNRPLYSNHLEAILWNIFYEIISMEALHLYQNQYRHTFYQVNSCGLRCQY